MSDNNFEAFDSLFEPLFICNRDLEIVYFNNSLVTFLQMPPRVIKKAKVISDLFPKKTFSLDDLVLKAIEGNTVVLSGEQSLDLNGSDYTVIFKIFPIDGPNHYAVTINDMSVEKRLYDKYREQLDELRSTHDQIVQADKLRAIGELTAGISHEINNPLTVASGNAELIGFSTEEEDLNGERENIKSAVENIMESHDRIHKIIQNMKDFLHQSKEKREYCRLKDIIERVVELVSPSFNEAKVAIITDIKSENIVGLVNRIKIEQVLVNLCNNALDAIVDSRKDGGEVKIILEHKDDDTYVNIHVMDNGPGIPVELREDVFTTFFTTKEAGKGTGLGLSISSRIIQTHQGRLSYVPEKNGAHFQIDLPIIEVSSYADNDIILSNNSNLDKKKVMIVDNEVTILNLCHKFLENEDIIFIGSTNGHDALNMLKKVSVDLLITDFQMPEMSGSELVEAMRAEKISTPVYYLTSKENYDEFQKDKEKLGVTGIILKPFSQDELLKSIKTGLGLV